MSEAWNWLLTFWVGLVWLCVIGLVVAAMHGLSKMAKRMRLGWPRWML